MSVTVGPDIGESKPLLYTQKARHRVVVGLSWDPRADKATFIDKLKGDNQQHDLDVICFIYDKDGNYLDYVGSEARDSMDSSGKIYHSGDDMTGEGEGDDEFISIEFADLPAEIHSIIFVAEVRSNHIFEDVDAPEIRVADGIDNANLFHSLLAQTDGKDRKACIALKLNRGPDSDTGWHIQNISDYPDISQIEDWGSYLTRYL